MRRFTHGVAPAFSRDLHVLGTPPAFVLSQDQTLHLNSPTIAEAVIEVDDPTRNYFDRRFSKSQKRSRGCSLLRESLRYCLVFKDLRPLAGNQPYKPRPARVSIRRGEKFARTEMQTPTLRTATPFVHESNERRPGTRASASSIARWWPRHARRARSGIHGARRAGRPPLQDRSPCRRRDSR